MYSMDRPWCLIKEKLYYTKIASRLTFIVHGDLSTCSKRASFRYQILTLMSDHRDAVVIFSTLFLLASSARLFLGMVQHGTVSSDAVHLQQPAVHRRADMFLTDKRYVSRLFGRWRKKMSLAGDHLSTSSKAHLVSPRHFQEKPIVLPAK